MANGCPVWKVEKGKYMPWLLMKKLTLYVNVSERVVAISIWGCNFWLQPMTDIHFHNLSSYTLHKHLLALNIIFEIYLALLICDFYFTFNSFLQNSDDVYAA